MNFQKRSYQPELLDENNIPFKDLLRNLQELEKINRWLGGHATTLKGVRQLLTHRPQQALSVCEIGCGGGDNLAAVARWADQQGITIHCTGIDLLPGCIQLAGKKQLLQQRATWITGDYRSVVLNKRPDIIFSSLFCHHFTDDQLVQQLQWMQRHARTGFFINDLHRHPIAYRCIQVLTRLLSRSYLVKNDAPLSVLRGFTRADWMRLFTAAHIEPGYLRWQWAFRYLITYHHAQQ